MACFPLPPREVATKAGTIDQLLEGAGNIDQSLEGAGTIDQSLERAGTIDKSPEGAGTIGQSLERELYWHWGNTHCFWQGSWVKLVIRVVARILPFQVKYLTRNTRMQKPLALLAKPLYFPIFRISE